jgi:hypothetical protein
MPTYNVHIYREMRLVYGGLEADSREAAAAIAHDKPTDQADSIDDCDGETIAALVDVAGDEQYAQSRIIDFEPERQRRAARNLLSAVKRLVAAEDLIDDAYYAEIEDALGQAQATIDEAEAAGMASSSPSASDPAKKPYSVLLLYPDDANDGGKETYYAWVQAANPIAAIADAQRKALATNEWTDRDPADFVPLLVTEGHHYGQPLSND